MDRVTLQCYADRAQASMGVDLSAEGIMGFEFDGAPPHTTHQSVGQGSRRSRLWGGRETP